MKGMEAVSEIEGNSIVLWAEGKNKREAFSNIK